MPSGRLAFRILGEVADQSMVEPPKDPVMCDVALSDHPRECPEMVN